MRIGTGINTTSNKAAVVVALAVYFIMCAWPDGVRAQAYLENYGQNRVQERKFDWKFFDTKHFRVYHYDKAGRTLGRYVSEEAENNISLIEKKLGGQFPSRFNIILYNSYEEYRQTNVGLKDEAQSAVNTRAGSVTIAGDKLVVYFTGEHLDLRHQIRKGMAEVVMRRMVFGDNFKKMVKNALLLNLPPWVTEGYIAYLVDGWDAKSNNEWKSLLDSRPRQGFYTLAEEYPELAGKAFWKFVSTQYGSNTVKSLLYTMQQKTSLNKALKDPAHLNMKVTKAYDSCMKFYRNAYIQDAKSQERPDSTKGLISLKVPKDNTIIRNIRVSPMGDYVSYVAWKDGMYTVCNQRTSGDQDVNILQEGGSRDLTEQTDPNYPLLTWSITGSKLAILYKKGSQTNLKIYNSARGRIESFVIPPNRFDRVLGMCFMQDDDKLVFSAIKKSQTDLYMFTIKGSKLANITDDAWDDAAPVFVSGGYRKGVLFLSNRPKPNLEVPLTVNELPTKPMNVFFYNTATGSKELMQCSDMPTGTVSQPIQYGLDNFAYLYDGNGINNKYVVMFARNTKNRDSAYSVPITNYSSSIICHQYNNVSGEVADVVQDKDKYRVYFHGLQMPGENASVKTLRPTTLSIEKPQPAEAVVSAGAGNTIQGNENQDVVKDDEVAPVTTVKSGNAFQSEFSDTMAAPKRRSKLKKHNGLAEKGVPDSSILSEMTDSAYVKMKPSPYRYNFKPDFFQVKVNNNMLFSQYQSIASNGGKFANPSLGALTTISLDELLENQRITAGFQMPIDIIQGIQTKSAASTYFIQYQNFTKRLDWSVMLMRSVDKKPMGVVYTDSNNVPLFAVTQMFKSVLNMVQADVSYPFDRRRSLRLHTSLRQDRLVQKATDTLSLTYEIPNTNNYTSMSRLEYVFDNTISPTINILNGSRYKFYTEYMRGLDGETKGCYNIGMDARNYQKIYKNFIVANRLAVAHSEGGNKVQYIMGGVDNWIVPQEAPGGNQRPNPAEYGFQAMATSLRGYKQYARKGNSYAVFTTEFRLPLTTFLKRPVKSLVLKNLQFQAFGDLGTAWTGWLPESGSNNTSYTLPAAGGIPGGLNNVALTITVPNSSGVAFGYGGGLRTSLFGYFVRGDVAWNIEGAKPIIYIALGTDF